VKLSFKEERDNTMSMVVEVGEEGGAGVNELFRRATSQRERTRDFDVVRAKTPVQTQIDTSLWTSKGKSAKEA
jgi:hypothetical protein